MSRLFWPGDDPPGPRDRETGPAGWPAWYGPVAFAGAFVVTVVIAGTLGSALAFAFDVPSSAPGIALAGTLVQDLAFVVTAAVLAGTAGRVRPEHFGLRPIGLGRLFGYAAVAAIGFVGFSAGYGALVSSGGEQDTLTRLGADRGTVLLLAAALLVIVVAPFAEEVFFRGFFYRALRNRFSVGVAILADGALFGAIHFDGSRDVLVLLPLLALFGGLLCFLYERSGSLYPSIALHIINNALAFGASDVGNATVAVGVGIVGLSVCAFASRPSRSAARPVATSA